MLETGVWFHISTGQWPLVTGFTFIWQTVLTTSEEKNNFRAFSALSRVQEEELTRRDRVMDFLPPTLSSDKFMRRWWWIFSVSHFKRKCRGFIHQQRRGIGGEYKEGRGSPSNKSKAKNRPQLGIFKCVVQMFFLKLLFSVLINCLFYKCLILYVLLTTPPSTPIFSFKTQRTL